MNYTKKLMRGSSQADMIIPIQIATTYSLILVKLDSRHLNRRYDGVVKGVGRPSLKRETAAVWQFGPVRISN